MKKLNIDEQNISVSGKSSGQKKVDIKISLREVKHIRRCMDLYSRMHPQLDIHSGDDFSEMIYSKFTNFGRISGRMSTKGKKNKLKQLGSVCQFKGCNEREKLTIDHIRPISVGGNGIENLQLLCPQHHLLKEIKSILFFKELEVDKLKEKIELIKEGKDPSILGYQTLKKEKLHKNKKAELSNG